MHPPWCFFSLRVASGVVIKYFVDISIIVSFVLAVAGLAVGYVSYDD